MLRSSATVLASAGGVGKINFSTRFGSSHHLILASFGGPKEAQIETKSLLGLSGEVNMASGRVLTRLGSS